MYLTNTLIKVWYRSMFNLNGKSIILYHISCRNTHITGAFPRSQCASTKHILWYELAATKYYFIKNNNSHILNT